MPCCWLGIGPGACVVPRPFPPVGGAAQVSGRSIPCGAPIGLLYGGQHVFRPLSSLTRADWPENRDLLQGLRNAVYGATRS